MPREKKFKWSKEDYTLREFIETFSHCLPVTLYITEGWMGRDEDNAFSSDELYRIGAVKRQRRIVTEHESGYYVSIPVQIRKKVDLFFFDGKVDRSVRVADVLKAMKSRSRRPASMKFDDDKPVSFSFGADQGANINLGKMKIVDVYDERYLVGHSVWDGKLIDRKIPVAIPVYMTLQVAPVVSLVGGTEEDFRKVLADIEEQMTDAVTDVDVSNEIMLFPEDITASDYEYINPMATFSKSSSCSMHAATMTQSPAYPGKLPPKKDAWRKAHKEPSEDARGLYKKAQSRPPAPDPRTAGEIPWKTVKAVASPTRRSHSKALSKRPPFTEAMFSKTQRATTDDGGIKTISPMKTEAVFTVVRNPPNSNDAAITNTVVGSAADKTDEEMKDFPYQYFYSVKSSTSTHCPLSTQEHKTTTDMLPDVRTLSVGQLADRLRTLNIPDMCVKAFVSKDVDGELLTILDEEILTDEFHFSRFNAIKLLKHVKEGYLPNI